jgi:hypothetical protein
VETECTDVQVDIDKPSNALQPWQSWSMTVRCLILRLAQAAPGALLVWQAYARH